MKKFLLSAVALVVAIAANAATVVEATQYDGKLGIDISGEGIDMDEASDATITVSKLDDGTYTFVLNQFTFAEQLIGDATVSGLVAEENDGGIVLAATDKEAPLTNGGELAAAIGGKVVMTMTTTIKNGSMIADITKIHVELPGAPLDVAARFESTESKDVTPGESGINTVRPALDGEQYSVYDLSGRRMPTMQNGLNIVKTQSGKTLKIMK